MEKAAKESKYSLYTRIQEVLGLDTVIKKIGKSEWWMVVIGWLVEVGGKSEWWRVVIGWEENVGGEVVIFWDKSWRVKVVIFWDWGGSIFI